MPAGCAAHKLLGRFANLTQIAELTSGQAKHLLDNGFITQVSVKSYKITPAGEREYEAYLETLTNIARPPKPLEGRGIYTGQELREPPSRLGATDFLSLPSRRGDAYAYRDEKLPLLSMVSMADSIERKSK